MTEKRCKNCKHWGGLGLPGSMKQSAACMRIRHSGDDDGPHVPENFEVFRESEHRFSEGAVDAVACDHESFEAWVSTSPDFGCVLWEEGEPCVPTK